MLAGLFFKLVVAKFSTDGLTMDDMYPTYKFDDYNDLHHCCYGLDYTFMVRCPAG